MKAFIQAVNFDASEQLEAFVDKKTSKLAKFHEDITSMEVTLKVIKPESAKNKEAGIKVIVASGEFYASKTENTFEEAIDEVIDALTKQLVKHKEKSRGI